MNRLRVKSGVVGVLLTGCVPFEVPGLAGLVGPPQPLDPEPSQCGSDADEPHPTPHGQPIIGAADYHIHQFSNRGFGGRVVWGDSFHPEGIEAALSACGADRLCTDDNETKVCRVLCKVTSDSEACQARCEKTRCSASPPHGHFGVTDPVGAALGQGYGHGVHAYPDFDGWPHWNTYTHQQVYHRWLRRAFDGGLKLIVMLATTNEVLCKFLGHEHACDDMTNVDLQLDAARDLEAFIDEQNDCRVSGNGWYRIARSPQEARQIIESGAMAVVLGVEVDSLFNCSKRGTCTKESVVDQIRQYRDKGVRHVFPIHLFDNAFGGAAAYNDFFNFGNAVVNYELLHVEDCSAQGYEFQFGNAPSVVDDLLGTMARTFGIERPKYRDLDAHCNSLGLTKLGGEAINALMDAKMIIDVDHMSARARKWVLAQATARKYRGLVSGHAGFTELYHGSKKSEGQLTRDEVRQLVEVGGLLAPILPHGGLEELGTHQRGAGAPRVPHSCGHSAESFAQGYLYAVDAMREFKGIPAVGFGSDLNGLAGMPAPRFGPYACAGDGAASNAIQVDYPVSVYPGAGVASLERSKAGHRTFDINVDGYAHAGMFPDFVAELRAIGLSMEDLAPLFNSAEAYIRMWECLENPKARPDCASD